MFGAYHRSTCSGKGITMGKLQEYIKEKIEQAEANADSEWRIRAEEYASWYATTHRFMTTDDILIWLDDHGYHTKNNSAIGAVMRRLKDDGAIAFAGYRPSRRPSRCQNAIRVWKSLIYEEDEV